MKMKERGIPIAVRRADRRPIAPEGANKIRLDLGHVKAFSLLNITHAYSDAPVSEMTANLKINEFAHVLTSEGHARL